MNDAATLPRSPVATSALDLKVEGLTCASGRTPPPGGRKSFPGFRLDYDFAIYELRGVRA
jgi:hypothetical protein